MVSEKERDNVEEAATKKRVKSERKREKERRERKVVSRRFVILIDTMSA